MVALHTIDATLAAGFNIFLLVLLTIDYLKDPSPFYVPGMMLLFSVTAEHINRPISR